MAAYSSMVLKLKHVVSSDRQVRCSVVRAPLMPRGFDALITTLQQYSQQTSTTFHRIP
jgi:hypothetical protein